MTLTEMAAFLEYLKAYDTYLAADEIQVKAWHDAHLQTIPFTWACQAAARYHGTPQTDRFSPATLNGVYRATMAQREIAGADAGRSCGRQECRCAHTTCDHGFVESIEVPGAVAPCAYCKPETQQVLSQLPPPGQRAPWQMSAVSEHYRRRKAVGA